MGEMIRKVRKEHHLSQKALGALMTVSQSYICKLEAGQEQHSEMFIRLFCLLFTVNEKDLSLK